MGVPPVFEDRTRDACVVVPGIMGSVLEDTATGRPLWGLDYATLTSALSDKALFAALHADAQEQAADADTARRAPLTRIRATGLLTKPWWLPVFQGLDPYSDVLKALQGVVPAPEAVQPFPYDWRLAVSYNGALLARAARAHLERWRERVAAVPEWAAAGGARPRLLFVAHSMGGLVLRAALEQDPELAADTRAVVTVGTPFLGSAKSVLALNLPHGQAKPGRLVQGVQAMAATLPGVHDLLPGYRCLDRGLEVERLTAGDVARFGGDRHLAARSLAEHARHRASGFVLPGHRAVVGEAQPTVQTLEEQRADPSVVAGRHYAFDVEADGELIRDPATGVPARRDASGDSTVHMPSARTGTEAVSYVFGQHGTLMRHDEVLRQIRRIALERPQGTDLGDGTGDGPGLSTPHLGGTLGVPLTLTVTGLDTPADVTLSVRSATTGRPGHPLVLHRDPDRTDGALSARFTADAPDLYRVALDTGRHAPVTQLVLVTEPDA
ncbi:lipase/acyltransferase domain-containing protein [Streptomyces erythrochromogenes]|uniref:lipase/acyltransferase domain-containing protein n=1 Tax=Streptomyces erythrochromogenes TaxID=285574 RepID=UPI0036A0811A